MWNWLVKRARRHVFEPAISLRADDGRLGVLRCTRCGYCKYAGDGGGDDPTCVPHAHEWVPVKVFQWEHLALADKLPRPLQCALCGAHASTGREWEKYGCPGPRQGDR